MISLLKSDSRFGRIHHGFSNDRKKLSTLLTHCNNYHDFREIAEGDLCWIEDQNEIILYLRHPYFGNRLPTKEAVRKGIACGKIVTLEDILDEKFKSLCFIVELKNGTGNLKRVFEKLLFLLETRAKGRYWIDTFSTTYLKLIKSIDPKIPTSLHTRIGVYGKFVIKTAFETPYILPINLYKIDYADIITITYKYSPASFLHKFGYTVNGINRYVFEAGKELVFGGVGSDKVFDIIRESNALGAYLKYNKKFFSTAYED